MTKQDQFVARAAVIANVVLTAGGIASTLLFGYFLYLYSWTAERQFSSWTGVLVYYVGPALLAGLLFASLRLKRDHKINLAVACMALVLSVYAGEVALYLSESMFSRSGIPIMVAIRRSDNPQKMAVRLAKEQGVAIDARDTLEVITDLRRKGVDAVPSVIAIYQLRHHKKDSAGSAERGIASPLIALGGISNKVTVLCNENGQFVTYESDEHGFRNPKGLWQRGHVDIVTLGDSFTHGYCVDPGKSYVDIIRQQHPATLNLGMAGEGPLLMLSAFTEYVPPLRPKVVLWFFFEGNDMPELAKEKESALLVRYLEDGFSQKLLERQTEIDKALVEFVETEQKLEIARRKELARSKRGLVDGVVDSIKLSSLRSRLGLTEFTTSEPQNAPADSKGGEIELFRQILSRAKASVEAWGGRLYFVYLPNWTRYDKRRGGAPEQRAGEVQRDNVLRVARALEVPIVDVLPAFDAHPDPMALFPFRAPGHYTEGGHELVAREVLKVIARTSVAGPRP
jgi:hypothetical protein